MKRRKFLAAGAAMVAWGSVRFLYPASPPADKERERAFEIIGSVQRHFFPKGLSMPDAERFGALEYLKATMAHPTFDPDIRAMLFEGARRLDLLSEGAFPSASSEEKERLLRRFEADSFGGYWLAQLMNLTLEALLGDPLYGGNREESGWRAFALVPGKPRPKERYGGV
ncbi:gluconate 2-dehydrogenase subunit 3 family protein [Hydrogenimonas sp.]